MSKLAQQLIAENRARHVRGEDASILDLGRCGLEYIPDLSDMYWVKKLIVSNRWWNFDRVRISSSNEGGENKIKTIRKGLFPPNLTELIFGGDYTGMWEIEDITPLGELTKLERLSLRGCFLDDISALEPLVGLKELNLGLNKLSSKTLSNTLRVFTELEKLDLSGGTNRIKEVKWSALPGQF